MRKLVIPGIVSTIVIALAILFMMLSDPGGGEFTREADDPEVVVDASVEVDTVSPATRADFGAATPNSDLPADEIVASDATLSGTVTDEFGTGLVGSRVFLIRGSEFTALFRGGDFSAMIRDRLRRRVPVRETTGGIAVETTTDANGRYSIPLARIPRGNYVVYARFDEFATDGKEWEWTNESATVDFALAPGGAITGIVVDPRGNPVAGASVTATPQSRSREFGFRGRRGSRTLGDQVWTDERGEFLLSVASGTYDIEAEAAGFTSNEIEDVDIGVADVVVELRPGATLTGVVRSESGGPVAGAEVALVMGGGGRGTFGRGGRGGRGGRRGDRGDGEPSSNQNIRVADAAGFWRWAASPRATAVTGSDGRFEFAGIPADDFALLVERPGFIPVQASGDLEPDDDEAADADPIEQSVEISLRPGGVISGIVRSDSGEAIGGALVAVAQSSDRDDRRARFGRGPFGGGRGGGEFRGRRGGDRGDRGDRRDEDAEAGGGEEDDVRPPEPVSLFRVQTAVETAPDGSFALEPVAAGSYSLSVQSDRHPVYRVDDVVVEQDIELEVQLEPGSEVRGRVRSSRDDSAVADAQIRFSITGRNRRLVEGDAAGNFVVDGVASAEIEEVRIAADGYTTKYVRDLALDVRDGKVEELEFVLDPAASLRGRVVDTDGQGVRKAMVRLTPQFEISAEREDISRTFRETFRRAASTRTDIDGRFEFDNLSGDQTYVAAVEHVDFRPASSDSIDVAAGDELEDIELVVRRGATAIVAVRGSGNEPVPGARVRLERYEAPERETRAGGGDRGDDERRAERRREEIQRFIQNMSRGGEVGRRRSRDAGPDGNAVFSGLEGGLFRVHVEAREFQPFYAQVTLVEDDSTNVVASLLSENFIAGRIVDGLGAPVSSARITATRETPDPASIVSEEDAESEFRRQLRRGRESEEGRSGPDGTFRIGQLGDSTYALSIRAEGFSSTRLEGVEVNRRRDFVLARLGGVAGYVATAETGAPIASYRARLQSASGRSSRTVRGERGGFERGRFSRGDRGDPRRWRRFEDPAGAFRFDDVPPGEYRLEVLADGHAGASVSVTVYEGRVTDDVSVALEEGLSISGTVVDRRSGAPLAGARILVFPVREESSPDGDSRAESRTRRESTSPTAGRRADRELRGTRREGRTGRRDGGGSSRELLSRSAVALLARSASRAADEQRSDDDGWFKVPEVTPGAYRVVFEQDGYVPYLLELDVDDTTVVSNLRVDLDPGETLSGVVELDGAAGVTVAVESSEGYVRRAIADRRGRYRIQGLLPGSYRVSLEAANQTVGPARDVDVKEGATTFHYRQEE